VNAPPPPMAAPSPAPRRPVQSTPLEAPSDAAPPAAETAAGAVPVRPAPPPPPVAPLPAVAQPALPAGPPARPAVAGAPPAPAVMPAPMPAPAGGSSATIVFVDGASSLSQPASEEVKAFAAKRGSGTVGVTGYGDSASSDPDAQSAALTLGLSRAQAIVEALKAAGVPGTAIRVSAEASGRGASLHLLQ
jgi:outer membrane protein OmpA-like peptidoglycan-associated protein